MVFGEQDDCSTLQFEDDGPRPFLTRRQQKRMLPLTHSLRLGAMLLGCGLSVLTVSASTERTTTPGGGGGGGGPPLDVPLEFDATTFQHALRDSTRPFWLIKFYAPYCQHCVRMAPVLGKVAKKVGATMAIGKVDCIRFKPICNRYGVKAYPTLIYVRNGEVFNYEGGRDESSFLAFAERLSQPAVTVVHDMVEATRMAREQTADGVAFVGMDLPTKDPPSSSELYKLFERVAMQNQATAHFVWLELKESSGPPSALSAYVQRLEPGVIEPKTWEFGEKVDSSKPAVVESLETWVTERTVPSLVTLGADNFRLPNGLVKRPYQTGLSKGRSADCHGGRGYA